ncbi:MAG: hypothetical protein KAS77_05185, partial [Thermoplasmata archaeon]|nr:hypothetical protein [Thermoplasmata archaeon]
MDRGYKIGIFALMAIFALLVIGTISVSADPANTNSAPTEDWVFDEGKTTTIRQKTWTVEYNITVMNGSVLKLEECVWTMEGLDVLNPVSIVTDLNSTLEIKSSSFTAAEGTSGYYIEAHDNLTITASDFEGLVEGPGLYGGITVIGNKNVTAQLDFVTVKNTRMADALWFENCQVNMSNCEVNTTGGDGVTLSLISSEAAQWYNMTVIDTEISNIDGQGLGVVGLHHFGFVNLTVFQTDIWNTTGDGIYLRFGTGTGGDGNGSIWATFDHINVYDIGDMGFYMSSIYQVTGMHNMSNYFNVTVINATFKDIKNTGTYCQWYFTQVNAHLVMEDVHYENVAMEDPTFDRLSGIWWWFYNSGGDNSVYVGNSSFIKCNPAGFESWDYGGSGISFYNVEFTQCKQAGVLILYKSTGNQSPWSFEECTFHDITGNGIDNPMETMFSGSGNPVRVINSTFLNLTGSALRADSVYYANNIGYNVSGSTFTNIDGLVIDIYSYYAKGAIFLHVVNSTFKNTGGVEIELNRDYSQHGGAIDAIFINVSFEDISGTAVSVIGYSYYTAQRLNVQFINSTVERASSDGLRVWVEVLATSSYYKPTWDGQVTILNSTFQTIGGIGISLSAGSANAPGTRVLTINYTTIHTAQRGIFN